MEIKWIRYRIYIYVKSMFRKSDNEKLRSDYLNLGIFQVETMYISLVC